MPLTAIEDFEKLGEMDSLYKMLSDSCKRHKGLWDSEAEKTQFD